MNKISVKKPITGLKTFGVTIEMSAFQMKDKKRFWQTKPFIKTFHFTTIGGVKSLQENIANAINKLK